MRKGMWEKVSKRHHVPTKIFPFGAHADEVMIYGTVDYTLKAGGQVSVDWAARARMAKEDGELKMDFYQVYLVSLRRKAVLMIAVLIDVDRTRLLNNQNSNVKEIV